MSATPPEPCISNVARICHDKYHGLCRALSHQDEIYNINLSEVWDELGRFRIWANNIGALLDPGYGNSLDYRLRDALGLSSRIVEILEDLSEALQDVFDIISDARPNRHAPAIEGAGSRDTSEVNQAFETVKDCVTGLMKVSIIIRKATPRDRYLKAAQASKNEPFEESFDISHVRHKFPKVRSQPWLAERLGKANVQRRQFLRYCREHNEKFQARQPQGAPLIATSQEIATSSQGLAAIVEYEAPKSEALVANVSTFAPTKASTLNVAVINDESGQSDTETQTSLATSMTEEHNENDIQIPQLKDVAEMSPFECPFCWTLQNTRKERAWRKHVLADLRPYVCTFKACDSGLFTDQRTWFDHELEKHRIAWICEICTSSAITFTKEADFINHTKRHITDATLEQLTTLAEASKRQESEILASSCPLCEWDKSLKEKNSNSTGSLVVTPQQFRHHLGRHMEQVALFALPRLRNDTEEAPSNAVIESSASHSLSNLDSHEWGSTAADNSEISGLEEDSPGMNALREHSELAGGALEIPPSVKANEEEQQQQSATHEKTHRHRLRSWPLSRTAIRYQTRSAPTFPRWDMAYSNVAEDGLLYLSGGSFREAEFGDVWQIDLKQKIMTCSLVETVNKAPFESRGHAAAMFDKLLAVSGANSIENRVQKIDSRLHLLDLSTKKWTSVKPQPQRLLERFRSTLTRCGTHLYLFGGRSAASELAGWDWVYSDDLISFSPTDSANITGQWTGRVQGKGPSARHSHTMVAWNMNLYLFGGQDRTGPRNDVWMYDTQICEWSLLECSGCIPLEREDHAAAVVDGIMYVFGGRPDSSRNCGDLVALDLTTKIWFVLHNVGPAPSPRGRHGMCTYDSKVYIFGGTHLNLSHHDDAELTMMYILDTSKLTFPSRKTGINSTEGFDRGDDAPVLSQASVYCRGCRLGFMDSTEINIHHQDFPLFCWEHAICLSREQAVEHSYDYNHSMKCFVVDIASGGYCATSNRDWNREQLAIHVRQTHLEDEAQRLPWVEVG